MASEFTTVVGAGKGWTRVRTADGREYTLRGARNWRNNNPGNIEYGPFARSMGAIGSDGRFAVFPSYDAGRQAKSSLLFNSPRYNTKTIEGAISKYAPPTENNTNSYISRVARALGLSRDTPINTLNPQQQSTMMDAMQRVEGFRVGRAFDEQGNIVDPSALQANQTGGIMQAINAPIPQQRPAESILSYGPVERRPLPALEPQVSLDTLRQNQPKAPAMSLAQQYASYGAGKQPAQIDGLLSPTQRQMIDQLNAQKGLLAQGVNPMDTADPWTPRTVVPGPIEQPVADVPQVETPQVNVPQVDPMMTGAAQSQPGLLTQEQMLAGAKMEKDMRNRALAGRFAGGLLGGLTLGPLGAIAGGLLGNTVANRTYYPDAPQPVAGANNSRELNSYGRSVNDSSRQFRDAMSKGGIGLY